MPSPPHDPSFFNADDMAADISSFLAQSRNEEPVVEEDFVARTSGCAGIEEDHTLAHARRQLMKNRRKRWRRFQLRKK